MPSGALGLPSSLGSPPPRTGFRPRGSRQRGSRTVHRPERMGRLSTLPVSAGPVRTRVVPGRGGGREPSARIRTESGGTGTGRPRSPTSEPGRPDLSATVDPLRMAGATCIARPSIEANPIIARDGSRRRDSGLARPVTGAARRCEEGRGRFPGGRPLSTGAPAPYPAGAVGRSGPDPASAEVPRPVRTTRYGRTGHRRVAAVTVDRRPRHLGGRRRFRRWPPGGHGFPGPEGMTRAGAPISPHHDPIVPDPDFRIRRPGAGSRCPDSRRCDFARFHLPSLPVPARKLRKAIPGSLTAATLHSGTKS